MRKTLFTAAALLAFSINANAQDIKLGIKAGANFTTLKSNEGWLKSNTSAGYQAGVWGRIGGAKFHFQPEAYFTSKQTEITIKPDAAASELIKGDLKFTNIDIPLLIGTKIPLGPINAKLQVGPLFSFVLDQEATYGKSISNSYQDALKNYKDKFSAIVFGTGFDIGNTVIDLRYEYGLGNMSKYEGEKQTLNLWTISLGYSFF